MERVPDPNGSKKCYKCGDTKPTSAFHRCKGRYDGLQGRCKACSVIHNQQNREKRREYYANYRMRHPYKVKAAAQAWRDRNVEYNRERSKKYRDANRTKDWYNHIRRKYGLSKEDYDNMLSAQNEVCAICPNTHKTTSHGRLHVDHCHKTGKVRALLCLHCNSALGRAKDDPAILRKMAEYLEKHREE